MDLEVRKIHFVQEFLRLNNEQIIHKLEDMLRTEKSKLYKHSAEPISLDEFNSMIDMLPLNQIGQQDKLHTNKTHRRAYLCNERK